MSVMNDMLESEFQLKQEIESLRQQLADREAEVADLRNDRDTWKARAEFSYRERDKLTKREVMLRNAMLFAQSTCLDLGLDATEERLANALAATADLENVRLCEKEPVGSDFSGALYRAWEPKP